MKYNKILILFLTISSTWCFSQEKTFGFKRKLNPVPKEGWHSIVIPPDLFANCNKEFNDLRLYAITGKDTTEIPYLLKKRTTIISRQEVELNAINTSKKGDVLYMMFELAKEQKVNFIDLEFEQDNYFAKVKIEGSEDKKEWFELVNDQRIFSLVNAGVPNEYGIVNFPVTNYRYLRVSVSSDKPLTFTRSSFRNEIITQGTFTDIPLTWSVQEDKKNKQTFVDIKLDHFRPVSDISVEMDNQKDFYRYSQVQFLVDSSSTPKGWIKNYETVNEDYITSFKPNVLTIDNEFTKQIRLVINNADNSPLKIKNIKARGPIVELVANLTPQQEIYLFYGNRFIQAPSYELSHFEEKIPTTTDALNLGDEENITKTPKKTSALFENKIWLWAIMITVIAVLGFFTLKMMTGKESTGS